VRYLLSKIGINPPDPKITILPLSYLDGVINPIEVRLSRLRRFILKSKIKICAIEHLRVDKNVSIEQETEDKTILVVTDIIIEWDPHREWFDLIYVNKGWKWNTRQVYSFDSQKIG